MIPSLDQLYLVDVSLGYMIEAVIIIGGVGIATFLAKRQFRKRSKLAY